MQEGDEDEEADGTDPDEEAAPRPPPGVEGIPNGGGIDDQQKHAERVEAKASGGRATLEPSKENPLDQK